MTLRVWALSGSAIAASIAVGCAAALLPSLVSVRLSSEGFGIIASIVVLALASVVGVQEARSPGLGLLSARSLLAFFFALTFGLRPLYLFAAHAASSDYVRASDAYQSLTALRSQEIILFFARRPYDLVRASTATTAIGLLFFVCALVANRIGVRHVAQLRDEVGVRWRRQTPGGVVSLLVLLSLAFQARIVLSLGGLGATVNALSTQRALLLPFYYYVAISAGPVALVVYYATRDSLTGGTRLLFFAALAEVTIFSALTGSRSRALLPLAALLIVHHRTRRAFSAKRIVAVVAATAVVASAFLTVRQATQKSSFSGAITSVMKSPPSFAVFVNDDSTFDTAAEAVAIGSHALGNSPGSRLAAGLAPVVPHFIYGARKPPPTDVWFRQKVWGNDVGGGRPISIVGEAWLDFGLVGVAVAGVLLGLFVAMIDRRLRVSSSSPLGSQLAAAAFGLILLWTLLNGGLSLYMGQLLLYGVPLIVLALATKLGRAHAIGKA